MRHEYYKYAFFSGFTTISPRKHAAGFFSEEVMPIFKNYKDSLGNIQAKAGQIKDTIDEYVYKPVPYCLFGDFDLGVFSLTEDFGFATKEFKPSPGSDGFKYQVNTGIIPRVATYKDEYSTLPIFEEERLPGFFSGQDFYPFTGIAMVKLNNAMLVGTGQDFVKGILFFLITFIDEEIERLNKDGKHLFYILNESLGWNELTINFFGNSMRQMQELLLNVRSKRLFDIVNYLEKDLKNNPRYEHAKIMSEIIPLFENVNTDSLLSELIKLGDDENKEYQQSHPFIATSITYGFHAGLTDPDNTLDAIIKEKIREEQLTVFLEECNEPAINIGWKVKPGHEMAAHTLIKQFIIDDNTDRKLFDTTQSGKYVFVYPQRQVSVKEYLQLARNSEKDIRHEMHQNIIKFQSRIQWSSTVIYADFEKGGHHNYVQNLFIIPKEIIDVVHDKLRTYPVAHTIKGQIENLIINFNDAICDPLMYSYFMGLKQSLLSFLKDKFLVSLSKDSDEGLGDTSFMNMAEPSGEIRVEETQEKVIMSDGNEENNIISFLQSWNKAYWNRYFHSYYFTEITDFNIEHHGGIQQILFTYDTMYKLVAKRIYGHYSKGPFVNVQGAPTITSTQFYNTVNFNHLFRPAIYACECVHEAANHVIPFMVVQKQKEQYKFLLNFSNQLDPDSKKQFAVFEKNIRQNIDARDLYENEYIENVFGLNTTRQMVTDYVTYRLAYEHPKEYNANEKEEYSIDEKPFKQNIEAAIRFYNCHWFLFLMNTDLYEQSIDENGAWFFREDEFKEIFIRFNLMFHLFYDCGQKELEELNENCPSVELTVLWNCRKTELIQFVIRLGAALKKEFEKLIDPTDDVSGFSLFHKHLKQILDDGWQALDLEEKLIYSQITYTNFKLIKSFYNVFKVSDNDKYNIIIRKNKSEYPEGLGKGIKTNVDFYRATGERNIFLDPKGNIFSTSPERRKQIFERYIYYIKKMWDLTMKVSLKTYKEEIAKAGMAKV